MTLKNQRDRDVRIIKIKPQRLVSGQIIQLVRSKKRWQDQLNSLTKTQ
jgi:hypothetical protein